MSTDSGDAPVRVAQDRLIGVAMLVIGAVLFYETFSFHRVDWDWMGLPFWPRLVLGFLALLSLLFVVRGSLDDGPFQKLDPRAFLVLAGGVVYVALIPIVGYVIVTPLFIALYSFVLSSRSRRNAVEAVITAAVASLIIYYVFKESLYVQFPEGLLEEEL